MALTYITFQNDEVPFVGLRSFTVEDSILFFGRDKQIIELLQKLNTNHFICVTGSSGCGKSSLIKAGLIPKLKAGFLSEERDHWIIASMKPSGNPLLFLAQSITNALIDLNIALVGENNPLQSFSELTLKGIKESGVNAILDLLTPILINQRSNLLLLVDQFEELFTNKKIDEEKRNEDIIFVNTLLKLAKQKELPIYIIITMRSDYIGNCNKFYGLPEILNECQYLVPRLNRQQLKEVIELPVKLFGQKISARLVDILLNDCEKDLDQLPVLQHCLMRTYQCWAKISEERVIDLEQYEAAGTLNNAISSQANEIFDSLSPIQQSITEILFKSLSGLNSENDPIRRIQSLKELHEVCKAIPKFDEKEVHFVIERFKDIDCTFLVSYGSEDNLSIDISHESLMRQWDKLKIWIKAEQDYARKLKWLSENVNEKRESLRGIDLKDAKNWIKNNYSNYFKASRYVSNFLDIKKYINKSSVKESNYLKLRGAVVGGIFILMLYSIIHLIVVNYQNNKTIKAEHEREKIEKKKIANLRQINEDFEKQYKKTLNHKFNDPYFYQNNMRLLFYHDQFKTLLSNISPTISPGEKLNFYENLKQMNIQMYHYYINNFNNPNSKLSRDSMFKQIVYTCQKEVNILKIQTSLDLYNLGYIKELSDAYGHLALRRFYIHDYNNSEIASDSGYYYDNNNIYLKSYKAVSYLLKNDLTNLKKTLSAYKDSKSPYNGAESFREAFISTLNRLYKDGVIQDNYQIIINKIPEINQILNPRQ